MIKPVNCVVIVIHFYCIYCVQGKYDDTLPIHRLKL